MQPQRAQQARPPSELERQRADRKRRSLIPQLARARLGRSLSRAASRCRSQSLELATVGRKVGRMAQHLALGLERPRVRRSRSWSHWQPEQADKREPLVASEPFDRKRRSFWPTLR